MDPLIGQGLINLGGSLVAGGIGAAQQAQANKQNQRNFERQLEFNKSEAIAGREAQKISSQAREMQRAGLNPLGAGATFGTSPVTATSSALPNIIPSDNVASQFGLAARNFDVAQIRNLDANTRKTVEETDGVKYSNEILSNDARYREAFNNNRLKIENNNAIISEINSQNKQILQDDEIKMYRLSMSKLQSDLNFNVQSIETLKSEEALNIAREENVKVDTANGKLEYEINGVRLRLVGVEENRANWQLEMDKKFYEWDKYSEYVEKLGSVVSRGASLGLLGDKHVPSYRVVHD